MREFKVFDLDAGEFVKDLDGGDWACVTYSEAVEFLAHLWKDNADSDFEIRESVTLTMWSSSADRVESQFADKHNMAVVINNLTGAVDVWDFDFNRIIFSLPRRFADDDSIQRCLSLYVAGYKKGVEMGHFQKAREIERALGSD